MKITYQTYQDNRRSFQPFSHHKAQTNTVPPNPGYKHICSSPCGLCHWFMARKVIAFAIKVWMCLKVGDYSSLRLAIANCGELCILQRRIHMTSNATPFRYRKLWNCQVATWCEQSQELNDQISWRTPPSWAKNDLEGLMDMAHMLEFSCLYIYTCIHCLRLYLYTMFFPSLWIMGSIYYPTESYGKADHFGSVFSLALFPKGCPQRISFRFSYPIHLNGL